MDLSALIFVALAVAWAVYLIPKALKHHDEVVRSRSVERFSKTMRVLARREPISRRDARLVVTPGRSTSARTVETKASSAPTQPSYAARRAAAAQATKRRRNVLGLILLVTAGVTGLAVADVLTWPSVAVPVGLLVAWLVACRVMVKGERAAARPAAPLAPIVDDLPETTDSPMVPEVEALDVSLESEPAVHEPAPVRAAGAEPVRAAGAEPVRAAGAWDMVPTTLPTYVSKAPAVRRTVQTIDLDSTGVWSSGRNDDDSALARQADHADQVERTARATAAARRASGS